MAGEDPRDGWRLVAMAAGIVLFALVLVNIVGLLDVPEPWIVDLYQWTVVLAYALGHILLLLAFTIGTPSLDPEEEDFAGYDEDNDDGFERGSRLRGRPGLRRRVPRGDGPQARSVGNADAMLCRKLILDRPRGA
jgi:hypothetical protein